MAEFDKFRIDSRAITHIPLLTFLMKHMYFKCHEILSSDYLLMAYFMDMHQRDTMIYTYNKSHEILFSGYSDMVNFMDFKSIQGL